METGNNDKNWENNLPRIIFSFDAKISGIAAQLVMVLFQSQGTSL